MPRDEKQRIDRRHFTIAAIAIVTGATVAGVSLLQLTQVQTAPPERDRKPDAPADKSNAPRNSTPGETPRPMTPPPEPARPDADARKKGAEPALPQAPPEKVAPPINAK